MFIILAIDHTFYGFPGVITHAGCRESTKKACKSGAEVGYHAGKPIESVFYCFYKITLSFLWVYRHNKP